MGLAPESLTSDKTKQLLAHPFFYHTPMFGCPNSGTLSFTSAVKTVPVCLNETTFCNFPVSVAHQKLLAITGGFQISRLAPTPLKSGWKKQHFGTSHDSAKTKFLFSQHWDAKFRVRRRDRSSSDEWNNFLQLPIIRRLTKTACRKTVDAKFCVWRQNR